MNRSLYIDWLRILATIAVVTIHLAYETLAVNLHDQHLSNWLTGNLFDSMSRFAVPVFVMISGALLLNDKRELTYKFFFQRRFNKVLIPFIGWSAIYYVYEVHEGNFQLSISDFIELILSNSISVHLWFMYMILAMYIVTPLLKIFVKHASKKDILYCLSLWFLVAVLLRILNQYFELSFYIELNYTANYVGYFILGYYLSHYEIPIKWRRMSYIGIVIGLFSTFVGTYLATLQTKGVLNEFWYEDQSPNVLLVSIGLFIFFRYQLTKREMKIPYLAQLINTSSFGIYLIHILVIRVLYDSVIMKLFLNLHAFIAIPISILIVVCISSITDFIIKKIPVVKKLVP
ncbi:acyltransferase [Priestia filamentosa]|uniref:acyltransferase n=1 Tax=Priestia filamentosa TaxID=1402861 RepID=UPI003982189B